MYFKSILTFVFLTSYFSLARAELLVEPENVLHEEFGENAKIEHKNFLLTKELKKQLSAMSHSQVESSLFSVYFVTLNGQLKGYGFLDQQNIRTKNALILICLDHLGRMKRVEVIAFFEPKQYIPNKDWLKQFKGNIGSEPVMPGGNVTGLTGATLSAQAVSRSVNVGRALWKIKFSEAGSLALGK